jgi:hypothetical protein
MRVVITVAMALMLSGCIARTAANIVTAPVRAVGQAADWATTSQDESDRNRGRELRAEEERLGREWRECMEEREDRDYCDEANRRQSSQRSPEDE